MPRLSALVATMIISSGLPSCTNDLRLTLDGLKATSTEEAEAGTSPEPDDVEPAATASRDAATDGSPEEDPSRPRPPLMADDGEDGGLSPLPVWDAGKSDHAADASNRTCGNGVLELGEECDDGNLAERDGCSSQCRNWFDEDFTRRTRLDLDNPTSTEVSSFPLLVQLNATSIDWNELGETGVCFVAADHSDELPHEAEVWTPGTESLVWVGVPQLPAGPSHIWAYYGSTNSHADCTPARAVWRDEFVGVWHMADPTDSSRYGHTMTDSGTLNAPGQVGRGRQTDHQGNLIGPSDPLLRISGDLTISVWVRYAELSRGTYRNCVVSYGASDFDLDTNFQYGLYVDSDTSLRAYWAHGDSVTVTHTSTTASNLSLNEFHHIALVRDATADMLRFYYDGQLLGTGVVYGDDPNGGSSSRLMLGGNAAVPSYSMVGVMDEVRLSNAAHSGDWVHLEYLSMTGGLVAAVMDP